jgi:hypothetical protein
VKSNAPFISFPTTTVKIFRPAGASRIKKAREFSLEKHEVIYVGTDVYMEWDGMIPKEQKAAQLGIMGFVKKSA